MLSDFFRINLPYGIMKNDKNEWAAFNREYLPLGFNRNTQEEYFSRSKETPFVFTIYRNLSEALLIKLAKNCEKDKNGKINKIWLYNDYTNPCNNPRREKANWEEYNKKIKLLSNLRIKKENYNY